MVGCWDSRGIGIAILPRDGIREVMDLDIKEQWSQRRSPEDAVLESE